MPSKEGWYWVRYKDNRGIVICPAEMSITNLFTHKGNCKLFFTAYNDSLRSDRDKFYVGSKIEIPSVSLRYEKK